MGAIPVNYIDWHDGIMWFKAYHFETYNGKRRCFKSRLVRNFWPLNGIGPNSALREISIGTHL